MMADEKNYKIMENILQKINQKCISLPENEKALNNKTINLIGDLLKEMRKQSVLFDNLYEGNSHAGSYYEGLKVGNPDEYDWDCHLVLPKIVTPTVQVCDSPAFVQVALKTFTLLEKKKDESGKYPGLGDLLVEDKLSITKFLAWIESLITKTLNKAAIEDKLKIKPSVKKSGPAFTIKIEGNCDNQTVKFDVDLVFCFKFNETQWPNGNFRKNSTERKTFLVVPKCPVGQPLCWRLSFQEQEKVLLKGQNIAGGFNVLKPALRLIKKLRDRHNHIQIASYFIKTMFLWEITKNETLWKNNLSVVLMAMLNKYVEYLRREEIPYFWNEKYNLLSSLKPGVAQQVGNTVANMIKDINNKYTNDPFVIAQYFLKDEELEELRKEVNISERQFRKLKINEETSINNKSMDGTKNGDKTPSCDSPPSQTLQIDEELFAKCNQQADKLEVVEMKLKQFTETYQQDLIEQKEELKSLHQTMLNVEAKLDRLLRLSEINNTGCSCDKNYDCDKLIELEP